MILKKLKMSNIRSYKNLEIEFPAGSVLLSGDIGSGKTSILLALQFAIFGLQPGQKGSSLIRHGTDEAGVSLEFDVNFKRIAVERTIKRLKNNTVSQDYNCITIDGEKKELSTSEMKNKIFEILDYPKDFLKKSNLLYKFTVYTPQEEMKEIINERPEVRLDTLRHIFGIDRYKRIKENTAFIVQKIKESIKIREYGISELNNLREKFANENEKKIQLSREINNTILEYDSLVKSRKELEEKMKEIQKSIDERTNIDSELSKSMILINGKKALKDRIEKEILLMKKQIQNKIEFNEENFSSVSLLLEKHKNLLEECNKNFITINSAVSVLKSKKEHSFDLKKKIISLENCPTCLQNVPQEYKEKIVKRSQYDIEDFDRELEQKLVQGSELIKEIEKEKKLIRGYEEDKKKMESDRIKSEHQKQIDTKIKSDSFVLENCQAEITEIELKIAELKSRISSFKETELQSDKYKKEILESDRKIRAKEINLAEKNKELEMQKQQLANLEEEINKKEVLKSQLNYLRSLQDWLQEKFLSLISVTENNVMSKLRREFSNIFNEWFEILVSGALSVRLDEDFTPIIQNQDYEIDYEFLSGGERTAVALAYRLALNQVLNSLLSKIKTKNLLILDEPTDGFSEEQLDKMRTIFEQIKAEQIILVSHERKIEDFVDHVIRIKKDGTSCIEKQD